MIENYLTELADYLELTHPVKEISLKTGISQSTVSKYYGNKLKISRSFIKKINEAFNINYKDFINNLQNNQMTVNESDVIYERPASIYETKILLKNFREAINNAKKEIEQLRSKENTPKNAKLILEWKKFIFDVEKDIEKYKKYL